MSTEFNSSSRIDKKDPQYLKMLEMFSQIAEAMQKMTDNPSSNDVGVFLVKCGVVNADSTMAIFSGDVEFLINVVLSVLNIAEQRLSPQTLSVFMDAVTEKIAKSKKLSSAAYAVAESNLSDAIGELVPGAKEDTSHEAPHDCDTCQDKDSCKDRKNLH